MLEKIKLLAAIAALSFASIASAAPAAPAAPAAEEQSRKEAQQKLDAAQQRLEQAAREVAELSSKMATDGMSNAMMIMGGHSNRAMLGIGIGPNADKDADGVRVLSVSPGGPAAGAGVKAGDVIVEVNGTALKRDKDHDANDKLMNVMAKLAPGDDVNLSYRRDGKVSAVKLKAEKLPHAGMPIRIERRIIHGDHPDFDEFREFDFEHGPHSLHMGAFGAIELVPLSPKLGQYFGTDKGLLMVRVPQDKELKLEDGDVLIDVDGRVPSNPGHAFRILSSYQTGEKVTLNVLRQRKKMAIAITVPEDESGPRPPIPPRPPRAERPAVAPVPPVPPTPPAGTT